MPIMTDKGVSQEKLYDDIVSKLSYTVNKEPLWRETGNGKEYVRRMALVRQDSNRVIGTCTPRYEPAQMADVILKNVDKLRTEGWKIPYRPYGRQAVRIEAGGLRAFVEMVNEESYITTVDKDKIFARFTMFNGFDLQTKFGGEAGGYQYSCDNGMFLDYDFGIKSSGHRHVGQVARGIDDLRSMANMVAENYDKITKSWVDLQGQRIPNRRGLAALESVNKVKSNEILKKINRVHFPAQANDNSDAWDWFNGITNWLTFEFQGSHKLFNKKQVDAQAILMGGDHEPIEIDQPDSKYYVLRNKSNHTYNRGA